MTRGLLLTLALAACQRPTTTPAGDTDVAVAETDTGSAIDACTGTRTLDLLAASDKLGRVPVAWNDVDIQLGVGVYSTGLQADVVDGCLHLAPGSLEIALTHTGCGGSNIRVGIVDACGTTCTRVEVFAGNDADGEDRNTRSGAEDQLEVAPTIPFTRALVSSLDARLCSLTIDLAPLPPELIPEDTAKPF